MFVFTAKLSKTKIAIAAAAVAAVVAAIIWSVGSQTPAVQTTAATNDDRLAFLASFGWSVDAMPVETQQVLIPQEDSEIFSRYNQLQISQGYDLSQFAGKNATRYVYEILNDPDAAAPVYATLLVYNSAVIGGDITGSAADAPMHGFAKLT